MNPVGLRTLLVTGGAGFIGSTFVRCAIASGHKVITLDALTYAGSIENLSLLDGNPNHIFIHGSILDSALVSNILLQYKPDAIVHLAAETHVDRSIVDPDVFIDTNVLGTLTLLQLALSYWLSLSAPDRNRFRFLHISTDEVYGALPLEAPAFNEESPYRPSNPYAVSKAAADHLARAWFHTYGLPILLTNCSNNYGPRQFPEKLIPCMLHNALHGLPLSLYGDGYQFRDWLYVDDHCQALLTILQCGDLGETYNIAGLQEQTNLTTVHLLCSLLDELHPQGAPHNQLIQHVADRLGHDRRYAIDCSKLQRNLGWKPTTPLAQGLRITVEWYLANPTWINSRYARAVATS